MLGWNPFWVFLDFQAQPRAITLGWALKSRKTLKGVYVNPNSHNTQAQTQNQHKVRNRHLMALEEPISSL
jgi:hypothetical protein